MKYFEKKMKKVYVKDKFRNYTITINKGDDVDETKFINNECDVIVCYKDDFDFLIKQKEDKQNQVSSLNQRIIQLENELNEKTQSNKSSASQYYEKIDEMQKKNSDLKQKHEDDLSAINEDHQKEIKKITDELNAKIERLKEIIASRDELIKENEAKYQDEIQHMREDHSSEASSLSQKISNLENQNLQEINNLEKSQSDEISTLKENHANEILELEKAHKDEVIALNKELSSIKLNHEKEINELKQSNKDEVSELKQNQFNKEYHMNISDHNKEISKVKDYLVKLRVKDHQDTIRFASDFEDLGFIEKHTSKFTDIIKEMKENDEKKLLKIDEDFSRYLLEAPDDDNQENE